MSQTFLPGYAVAITIDADTVIGLTASQYNVQDGPGTGLKAVFGSPHALGIATQATGTLSLSGHATAEALPLLAALRAAAGQPVAIEITFDSAGNKDTLSAVVRVTHEASADDEVNWAIEGDLVAAPQFTAAP